MSRLSAVLAGVALLIAASLTLAAPASAAQCAKFPFMGDRYSLSTTGVSCAFGKRTAVRFMRTGARPADWVCNRSLSTGGGRCAECTLGAECDKGATRRGGKRKRVVWREANQSAGGGRAARAAAGLGRCPNFTTSDQSKWKLEQKNMKCSTAKRMAVRLLKTSRKPKGWNCGRHQDVLRCARGNRGWYAENITRY